MIISRTHLGAVRLTLSSLAVVGLLGVLLRYKIAFPLPLIHQKHLLHAHSHFAFYGWISQLLMVLIVIVVEQLTNISIFKNFTKLFFANLVFAYGMLFSFSVQGYGLVSITFSTLAILLSYLFGFIIIKKIQQSKDHHLSFLFFKAAIIFNIISSIGVFSMAYLMMNRIADQNWYLATVYFFLHFQYNGWFLFSALGIFLFFLEYRGVAIKRGRLIFWMFFISLMPAYLLSTLWASLPVWVYILAIVAAMIQCIAWALFIYQLISQRLLSDYIRMNTLTKALILISIASLTLKFLLQLFSTIPALGQFAFGVRPIVIAYLHLVLILSISSLLIAMVYECGVLQFTSITRWGLYIFFGSAILNEVLLMIQGVSYITPYNIGVQNGTLFTVAIMMCIGTITIFISSFQSRASSLKS